MTITLQYGAQIKQAAGTDSQTVEVDSNCSLQDLLRGVANERTSEFKEMLFAPDGALHPSILLFVGDDQVRWNSAVELQPNDVVSVLSPISGG